jgi:hypothetical protein
MVTRTHVACYAECGRLCPARSGGAVVADGKPPEVSSVERAGGDGRLVTYLSLVIPV